MIVRIFITSLIGCFLAIASHPILAQDPLSESLYGDVRPRPYSLRLYLWDVGPSLGLQFTEESTRTSPVDAHSDIWAKAPLTWKDRDAFLKFLKSQEQASGFIFRTDSKYPRVIHVIASELVGMEDYALDQEVAFEFAGTLGNNMISSLHKQVDNLEGRGGAIRLGFPDDGHTPVVVDFDKRKVRQILTDAVPLECYGTYLWRAVTEMKEGRPMTSLRYFGLAGFDDGGKNWPWWEWLNSHTKEYGCRFTIEFAYRPPDGPDGCPPFFSKEEKFGSIDDLLAELQKRVPYLNAIKDAKRPEIIHLIDRELLKRKDYALNQPVTIDYVGNPDGLIPAIAPQITGFDPRRLVEDTASDEHSKITVHAQNMPLRSVLTDCVPLTAYSGVIWQARTWLKPDDAVTGIRYEWLGMPTSKAILRGNADAHGRWLRENTDKSEAEVTEYVRQERAQIEKYILKLEESGQMIPEE